MDPCTRGRVALVFPSCTDPTPPSPPLSRCAATAQCPCWSPIQPLSCNAQSHSSVTHLVTRDSNFGNQTPFAPRIRCPLPPSPSLHLTTSTLCPPQGASILSPICLPSPVPLAPPLLPSPPSPLRQPLMLLHCAVLVSGFWGVGLWVVMGWAECRSPAGLLPFSAGIWQAAASAVAWREKPPRDWPSAG